jgi:hypothetical protein
VVLLKEIVFAVQVYASITPVVYLVNVGSESGGVRSLANVTVRGCLCLISLQLRYWSLW